MNAPATLVALSLALATQASWAEDLSLCQRGWTATQNLSYDLAIALYADCVKKGDLSQASLARTYRNMAITYRSMGEPVKALEFSNKALELQPADAWNDHVNRGNALSDLGRFDEALADFDQAAALKPGLADVHFNRGVVYERQGKRDQAKVEFAEAYRKGLRSRQLYERMVVHGLIKPGEAKP